MKEYIRNSIIKLLLVISVLSGGFGLLDNSLNQYQTFNIAKEVKAQAVEKKEEQPQEEPQEEKQEEPVEPQQVEQQPQVTYVEPQEEKAVVQTLPTNYIEIPGALQKPLMKDETGEHFYLNHDENGNYNGLGVPYIDVRTDFNTRKTIIYSHSSTGGNGPFQALQNYHNNKGYYDGHRYITIHYNGNTYTYEIFSVYVSVADSESSEGLEYFHTMYYDDTEWEQTIQKYKNNSEYDTGVSVSKNDKILILQTCSLDPNYFEKYYRYNLLIMGKLV